MYPARFEYLAPGTWAEASVALAGAGGDGKALAGGCSLIPLLKFRFAEPRLLVDLNRIPDAAYIREEPGDLWIGAMTREADLEASALLAARYPIIVDTSSVVADAVVRNMGTLGGNVAHGDPANDHPATLLALGAEMETLGPAGPRRIPAADFFAGLYETALAPAELVTAIRVPPPAPGTTSAYVKFERQAGDFAVAAAAVVLRLEKGIVRQAAIALTNVGATAVRAAEAEAALLGRPLDDAAIDAAAVAARAGLAPWDELRGSSAYKLTIVEVVTRRALALAAQRVSAGAAGRRGR